MPANQAAPLVHCDPRPVNDPMLRLKRYLVLGVEGATYHRNPDLRAQRVTCVQELVDARRGLEVVEEVVAAAGEGRAAYQDGLILMLALCARQNKDKDIATKRAAYSALNKVCRTATHLFEFVKRCQEVSHSLGGSTGWGRAHRSAISNWYLQHSPRHLASMVTKYRSRDGWSHRDLLLLSHAKPSSASMAAVFQYAANKKITQIENNTGKEIEAVLKFLTAVENVGQLKRTEAATAVEFINRHHLVREHLPTELLGVREVWEALLDGMPVMAMIRNLGKLTRMGVLSSDKGSTAAIDQVVGTLCKDEILKRARIHPIQILTALNTYRKGRGDRGGLTWIPNQAILQALDDGFYKSIGHVTGTGKRVCVAVDVSKPMCSPVAGLTSVSCRELAAAMSMVTARTEAHYEVVAFSYKVVPVHINKDMGLHEVLDEISRIPPGGTDCAMPIQWAESQRKPFDVFIVYTDSETCFGDTHPHIALMYYRTQLNLPDTRLIVVAMAPNEFSIADPDDDRMLNVVGFDAHAHDVMRQFILGEI